MFIVTIYKIRGILKLIWNPVLKPIINFLIKRGVIMLKFNAEKDFDDLKEVFISFIDLQAAVVTLSDGVQFGEDLPKIIKFVSGLPAAIAGIEDADDALRNLTEEQHKQLEQIIIDRKVFPNDNVEEYVDDMMRGAIWWARGLAKALK